jgi:diguanylate cyclase (GGDEF)-like protein/PAS domain S-box-containing protein
MGRGVSVHDQLSRLRSEVGRLEKIVAALIGRAEAASDQLPTDFGLFQTTVLLEDQVRTRTSELNAAMTLLEESNRALHDSRAKFQAIFDLMPDPVTLSTLDGVLLEVSRSFAEFFGYVPAEMTGHRTGPEDLALWADPLDRERYRAAVEEGGGTTTDFACTARRKDGRLANIVMSSRIVAVEGARFLLTEFHDMTEATRQGQQLRDLAEHDALTGLPNRLIVLDRLQQDMALARRTGSAMAIAYLDLDGFKAINDQYGHQAGDQVLVEVARRLKALVRASDTVCRLGGDEFAVLLQGYAGGESFDEALERILDGLRMPYSLGAGVAGSVGASVGFTIFPEDDCPPLGLLEHADQAMYLAKRDGKNCCRRFVPSLCEREEQP